MKNYHQDSILIVDDTPTNLKVLFELLNDFGFKVSIAKSGESALEKVETSLPNLILLDVMMPGIDGFETCRRLKANHKTKDIPVIFMTALSDTVDKVKGLQLGAVDYITKPIEHQEALARINVHLELRSTQLKLVQEEKMSSLGQMVAGVAHEINNPINFIYGNLIHAQKYIEDLLKLQQLYEIHVPNSIPEIQAFSNLIELDFIKEDLPKLLSSMEVGTSRVQEIVRSLRTFSRLDEAEIKKVDLHEGLDSTLMILNSHLYATQERPAIEVVKEYGELPPVECYAGQLNQVFMNILSNAIDALQDGNRSWVMGNRLESTNSQLPITNYQFPTIWIRTELNPDKTCVLIRIKDNGIGMSQEVQQKIFDQFFTTKPVGKGTGLGLAIAHQIIVEKHGGTLEVNSTLGEGTEFIITIPVKAGVNVIRN